MIIKSTNAKLDKKDLFSISFIKEIMRLPKVSNAKLKGKPDKLINGQSPRIFEEQGIIKSFAGDADEVDGNILYFLIKHTSSPYYDKEEELAKDLGVEEKLITNAMEPKNRKGRIEDYTDTMFIKEIMTRKTLEKVRGNSKTIKDGSIPELLSRGLTHETIVNAGVVDIRNLNEEDLEFNEKEKEEILKEILKEINKEEEKLKENKYTKYETYFTLYKSKINLLNKYTQILPNKKEELEKEINKIEKIIQKYKGNNVNWKEDLDEEVDYFEDYFKQITSTKEHPILFPYENQDKLNNVSIIAGATNREDNSKYQVINKNSFDIDSRGEQTERLFVVEGKMDALSLTQMLKERGLYETSSIITLSNVNTAKTYELKKIIVNMVKNDNLKDLNLMLDNDNSGIEATETIVESIYETDPLLAKKIKKGEYVFEELETEVNDLNDLLNTNNENQGIFFSNLYGILSEKPRVGNDEESRIESVKGKVEYYKNPKEFARAISSKNFLYLKREVVEDLKDNRYFVKIGKDVKEFNIEDIKEILKTIKNKEGKYPQKKSKESDEDYSKRLEPKLTKKLNGYFNKKEKAKVLFVESGKTLHHNAIFGKDSYGDDFEECFFINRPAAQNPKKSIYEVKLDKYDKTTENGKGFEGVYKNVEKIIYEGVIKAHELELNHPAKKLEVEEQDLPQSKDFTKFKVWWINKAQKRINEINWKDNLKKDKAILNVKKELTLIEKTYEIIEDKEGFLNYFLVLDDIINSYKEAGIFSQIRGSAPSFVSFDLFGYTNLPDGDIENKLGEVKELMPPERFMSEYKFSMADVDIEVSSNVKEKAVKILNKKGYFLFLVRKELEGGEIQYAIHPCKMIELPDYIKPFVTERTKYIHLDKKDLGKLVEKAYDVINQNISRNENIDLNQETIEEILGEANKKGLLVSDVINNDLPQVTDAAKQMLLKYKGLQEEELLIKNIYGKYSIVVPKKSLDRFGVETEETLISIENGQEITSNYKKKDIESNEGFYMSINRVINRRTENIIKEYFPIEYNNNLELLNTKTTLYEVMSAAASNRPAFTGELITIEDKEYFFSIKDRKLTSIEDGSILEEKDYPELIKVELKKYFEHKYPVLEDKEQEEDLEEETEDKKLFLPKILKRRMVVDYIIENKKEREYFKSLNITNGSILFQEQMTSFLVKIAEEYIEEKNVSEEEKQEFITKWKKKGDICQSFVKKTASSLTKETIEEALSIFEDSKSLLNELSNESFKREALDIFKLQFFAFENGAYLYNGAHGEMVAYNAIQELLHKTKTKEISIKEVKEKVKVSQKDMDLYNQRKERRQEYLKNKTKEEERKAKERYDNSDEEYTLITGYNYKYVNNKDGKEYQAKHNDILLTLNEIKSFVKTKKLQKGFMVLTLNEDGEIEDKNKIYERVDLAPSLNKSGEMEEKTILTLKNLETYEVKELNEYLNHTFNGYIKINEDNKIWFNRKQNNKDIVEKNINQVLEFFKSKDIYSKEEVYNIDSETEAIFNIELPKKGNKPIQKVKVEEIMKVEDSSKNDKQYKITFNMLNDEIKSYLDKNNIKLFGKSIYIWKNKLDTIKNDIEKLIPMEDNVVKSSMEKEKKPTKEAKEVNSKRVQKVKIEEIMKVEDSPKNDKQYKITFNMLNDEIKSYLNKNNIKLFGKSIYIWKNKLDTIKNDIEKLIPMETSNNTKKIEDINEDINEEKSKRELILKNFPNYELLMRNERNYWKELPIDHKLTVNEQEGLTESFFNWLEDNKTITLQVEGKDNIINFELQVKEINDKNNITYIMVGKEYGVMFPLSEMIKIYKYSEEYKTSKQELVIGNKIKVEGNKALIEGEAKFRTLPHPRNHSQKVEGTRAP